MALRSNGISLEAQYLYRHALDLSKEGKKESALKCLKMAVFIAPFFCSAYNAMGNCLDELGRYSDAVKKYDKVLEINPLHAEAKLKRALVMKKIGRSDEIKGRSIQESFPWTERSTGKTEKGYGNGQVFRFSLINPGESG